MINTRNATVHLLLALFLTIATGCNGDETTENGHDDHEMTHEEEHSTVHLDMHKVFHAGIKVEPVSKKSLSVPLTLPGKVTFNERRFTDVTSLLGGRVDTVYVFLNEHVRGGAPMIALYSKEFVAMQYEVVQAFQRVQRSTGDDRDGAEGIYASIRKKLVISGISEADLDRLVETRTPATHLRIRAPFSGTILRSEATLGSMVEPGSELFEIADLSTVWILADIYEKDISLVRTGMDATVQIVAYPDEFTGRVTAIYNVVDPESRTIKARIEAPNPGGRLKPGMFCTVDLQTALGEETIKIPSSALLGDTEHHFVFVAIDDSTFERRDILTGAERRDHTEVLDGLIEGESIVIKGAFFLKSELAKETFGEDHH